MTDPAEATSTVAHPEVEKERGRGHIGLVVLGSILGGLILGLALTLGVFAGGHEDVITGAALIALAFGMLMLFELARRRTDQPQPWALVPALGIGVLGLALVILEPSARVLGWLLTGGPIRHLEAGDLPSRLTSGTASTSLRTLPLRVHA